MDVTPSTSTEGSLKALKIIFFAMMLILIGGAVFLFVSIYERNQGKTAFSGCTKGNIDIPVPNEIISMLQQDDTISLLSKARGSEQEIVVVDYCTGTLLRKITLRLEK